MELSLLLAQQIAAMFLMVAVGYLIVKIGLCKSGDSKVISNLVVYICSPCTVINSFQIELTRDKLIGLGLATVVSIIVHIVMIILTKLLAKLLNLNNIEKASIVYTNSGYLIIPLVSAVLGEEWVFYTTAFITVQLVLIWTHGVSLINHGAEKNVKKILLNPNLIATVIGLILFVAEIRLPAVLDACVSGFADMISPASMLVIGMVIGNVDLLWAFKQKRVYLICFLRLIAYPLIATFALAALGQMGIHPDAEYILLIVLWATIAPAAAMVTQIAQIYNRDATYASVINVISVVFCIVTMPAMTLLYECFF